ncbi:hypothetical protein AWH62_03575 [Maricaulis sp. W15]|uniref:hypothetical protein n=1 Tax=Maricaulis sp. W15 TaxID=1772333 RepID=UPI000948A67A|nr:hypothetical protein [Maricaulis sp. W15]OLF77765.1 hypothetical protein AWH62_03575 [Maricaulis sp. W15]
MRLRTRNGQLTLGSIYKLVVTGWTLAWCMLFAVFFVLMILMALTGAPVTVNNSSVTGLGPVLVASLPMMVLMPVIVIIQALIFGGLFVLAMMIYRMFRPITVETDNTGVFG